MINLFSSNELKLQKSQDYNSLHEKSKSLLRALVQKLFLTLLLRLFPKKFLSYKNKIKFIMNRGGYFLCLYLTCTYLRFRHPLYFKLPSRQLYAISIVIKFLKILKFLRMKKKSSLRKTFFPSSKNKSFQRKI